MAGGTSEGATSGRVRIAAVGLLLLYAVLASAAVAVHLSVQGLTVTSFAPVFFSVYPAMGTLILLRRGSHRIGWILVAIGIVLLLQTTPDDYAVYALALHPGSLPFGQVAVYFCVLEALQNIQKYAGANNATIRLREENAGLRFEVEHNGRGFDPEAQKRGSGTQNMEDRIDALDGSVSIVSSVGSGTRMLGTIPLRAAVIVG